MEQKIHEQDIDLIVYDFDGVMTDNRVLFSQDGIESVMVNRADGLGVDLIRAREIPQIIISTETNPVVKARAKKIKLPVIDSCNNKKDALIAYCKQSGYQLQKVIYVGNDINDLDAMSIVGYPITPVDGHPEIKAMSKICLYAKGGQGVVRELADMIVSA